MFISVLMAILKTIKKLIGISSNSSGHLASNISLNQWCVKSVINDALKEVIDVLSLSSWVTTGRVKGKVINITSTLIKTPTPPPYM